MKTKTENRLKLSESLKRSSGLKIWRDRFIERPRTPSFGGTEIIAAGQPDEIGAAPSERNKPPIVIASLFLVVIVPFLVSVLYYGAIASDQFISEARFAVRSVAGSADNTVDSGVLSMSSTSQDAYVVTSFIHSSEILDRLREKIDYRAVFSSQSADFWSRLSKQASQEEILRFWNESVQTNIDGPSGIVTLRVKTFDPQSAKRLATMILKESETLLEQMSRRAKIDVIARADEEMARAEKVYKQALVELNRYQNVSGILDPVTQSSEIGKLMTGLVAKNLEIQSRLAVLRSSSSDASPAFRQLLQTQQALETQIEDLRSRLTGQDAGEQNLASSLVHFSELETDRLMAEKLYEASRTNFSAAQADALKKALYLVVFVSPHLPEMSVYPRRLASPVIIFLTLLTAWITGLLIWASVEDHRL